MWYSASLFFESVHNSQSGDDNIWEEQIVLFWAGSEAGAREKAEVFGRRHEHAYQSATGDQVQWKFRAVQSIFELIDQELKDGTEAFSRFVRPAEAQSLLTDLE